MAVCPKCNIAYEAGKKYCRKCGSLLLTEEKPLPGFKQIDLPEGETTEEKLLCPKCKLLYEIGNYCRKCGSLLMEKGTFQETNVQPFGKRLVKRRANEWRTLLREKKKLQSCMSQLETQRDRISSDVLNPLSARYHDQLESLSSCQKEIEAELESIRKTISEEIDLLEKELEPIQKKREELQSLHRLGAITKADFSREKKQTRKEIALREKHLKKHRQIISLLPTSMGEDIVSPWPARALLRPLPVIIASGIIVLMVAWGYYHLRINPQSGKLIPEESSASPRTQPSHAEDRDIPGIRSLFENIREANLRKNMDLFMSCYALDYEDRNGKRLETLQTWKHFDYLDLSYELKNQKISAHTANVRVEWRIKISQRSRGKTQESKAVLDVLLKKEDGYWKIKETNPVT